MTTITPLPLHHSQLVKATCFLLVVLLPLVDMIDDQQGRRNRGILDTGQVTLLQNNLVDNGNTTAAVIDRIIGGTVGTFFGGNIPSSPTTNIGWQTLYPSPSLLPASVASSSASSSSSSFPASTHAYSGETTRTSLYLTSFLPQMSSQSTGNRHRHVPQASRAPPPPSYQPPPPPPPAPSATSSAAMMASFSSSSASYSSSTFYYPSTNETNTNKVKVFSHHQKKSPLMIVEPPVSLPVSSLSSSSAKNAGPYFESNKTTINVIAREGQTVILDCAVALLQGRTVSWLRRRKDSLQLLTVGNTTYHKDSRLGLKFRYPNNWRLGIDQVARADEGEYQCQLSTHPVLKTLIYRLKVIAPAVIILDENGQTKTERHYKVDSSLHLTCKASHVDKGTENRVTWLKGGRALPISDKRIKVRFEKNPMNGEVSAYLSVTSVNKGDSGNYTCRASSQATSTIVVHVLNGELPAAVQHENSANSRLPPVSSGLQLAFASVVGTTIMTMMMTTTADISTGSILSLSSFWFTR